MQKSIESKKRLLKEKKGKEKGEKREKMRSKYSADKSRLNQYLQLEKRYRKFDDGCKKIKMIEKKINKVDSNAFNSIR